MLYYKNNHYNICNKKVKYIEDGKELENFVGQEGNNWWEELVDKGMIEIVEFTQINVTEEQLTRLEEVNQFKIGDGHSTILADYVIRNTFPVEVNHILKDLENKIKRIELETENKILIAKVQANADLSDFHEELIVELAMEIYK